VFEGDTDTLPLFTVRNKWSLGGPKMVVNFTSFDDKAVELQVRGKLLDSGGKITWDDQLVARFEGGVMQQMASQPDKLETVSKITVAPLGKWSSILLARSDIGSYLLHDISRCGHGRDHLYMPARHFQQRLNVEA